MYTTIYLPSTIRIHRDMDRPSTYPSHIVHFLLFSTFILLVHQTFQQYELDETSPDEAAGEEADVEILSRWAEC